MKRLFQLFLALIIVHCFSFSHAQHANLGVKTIVIDPGHGGKDPGTLGTGRYKQAEKDVVLDVSIMLGKYLQSEFDDIEVNPNDPSLDDTHLCACPGWKKPGPH